MKLITRILFWVTIVFLAGHSTSACDYTIRDIGFVQRQSQPLKLIIHANTEEQSSALISNLSQEFRHWNFSVVPLDQTGLKVETAASFQAWLQAYDGRRVEVASAESSAALKSKINAKLDTPLASALRANALSSFAQLIVVATNSDSPSFSEEITTAVEAATRLNALQPKPNLLPTTIHNLSESELDREEVLLFATGLGTKELSSSVVVVYGRGILAGPPISDGDSLVRELLSQLSLVGASCECGTNRTWTTQNVLPFLWSPENANDSLHYLKFDPNNNLVRTEVDRILGQRAERTSVANGHDPIAHLVESYIDSELPDYAARSNTAAEGSNESIDVEATVLQGEGWDFEESTSVEAKTVALPPGKEVESSQLESVMTETESTEITSSSHPSAFYLSTSWLVGGGLFLFTGVLILLAARAKH